MTDSQFEALLSAIRDVSESIDLLSDRVAMVGAAIVKVGDPDGWESAQKTADNILDDEDDYDDDDGNE